MLASVLPTQLVVDGSNEVLDQTVQERDGVGALKNGLPGVEVSQRRRPGHDLSLLQQVQAHTQWLRRREEIRPVRFV